MIRLVAVLALAGQLQQLPAVFACTLRHRVASAGCDDHARSGAVAIAAAQDPAPTCSATGPCAPAGPAGLLTAPATSFLLPTRAAPTRAALVPHSFTVSPIPPPPLS